MTDQTESASEYAVLLRNLDFAAAEFDGHPAIYEESAIAIRALEAKVRWLEAAVRDRNLAWQDARADRDRLAGEVERIKSAANGEIRRLRQEALNLDAEVARLTSELAKARDAVQNCVALLENADCSDGCCCCGTPVELHGMGDGHSPVDAGEYHKDIVLSMAKDVLAIDAARRAGEGEK